MTGNTAMGRGGRNRRLAAGFAGICAMMAAITAMLLLKRQYASGISNLFNLSMDVLGALVSILLYYGCFSAGNPRDGAVRPFAAMLFVAVLTLFLDVLIWFAGGNPAWRAMCIVFSTLFYLAVNLLVALFWRYARAVLGPKAVRPKWMEALRRAALALVGLLYAVNLFSPVVFRITPEGLLEKEPGYPLGYVHILVTFVLLIYETFPANIERWKRRLAAAVSFMPIAAFLVTSGRPQIAVAYTVATTAILACGCVLYDERIRLKALVTRVFALLLLCAMLIYGPIIYAISFRSAIQSGFETADGVMTHMAHMLDEIGLDALSEPGNAELYQHTREELREVCRVFGLQNIYVETIDAEGVRSFIIAVAASDEEDAVVRETLGWPGASVWSETSSLTEPELRALAGEYTDLYSEQNNDYGHNLDWFYPYKDASGRVAALLGVDIAVEKQQLETVKGAIHAVIPALMLYFLTLLVLIHMLDRAFLKPIFIIARHIQSFVSEGNRKREALSVGGGYEIWLLSKSFDFMTNELNEYEAIQAREIQEKQRAATEMELAARIQGDYLPGRFPPFPERREFDIHASMRPAREVGGDFYDFFLMDDDHLAMVVADVSGKGVPAALFMMISRTVLRSGAQPGSSPAEVLEKVNAQLAQDNDAQMFVTVWLGILEISTGVLTFSDAGHERLMLRSGGSWSVVPKRGGLPLAMFMPAGYHNQTIALQPGDCLFQYTDGVTEAANDRREFFGEARLLEALNGLPTGEPEAVLSDVRREIDAFVGGAPQFDDITMLCLCYRGK